MKKFSNFWFLISKKEKFKFFFIVFFLVIQAILEMIGIAAVLPFVTFLLKPEALSDMPIFSEIFEIQNLQLNDSFIIFLCFIFFAIFFFKNLFILLTNNITFNFVFLVRARLYANLLKKIIHQDYIFYIKNGIPKISNILTVEVNNFAVNVIRPVINLTSELLVLFAIVFLILITGNFKGLITILPFIILIGLILKRINKLIKNWSNQRIINNEKIISLQYNLVNSIKEVIIYGKIEKILNQFSTALKNLKDIDTKNNFVLNLPKIFLEQSIILIFILIILFLNFSGQTYDNIIITLSFYLAVSYRLVPSLNKIFVAYQALKFGQPSIPKVMEFHKLEKTNLFLEKNDHMKFNDKIELKDIKFQFHNERQLIKNLNLKIKKFDFIGIYGESGSGKSTFINILTNLLKKDEGKIFVDEKEVTNLDILRKYQNLFSVASQDTFLVEGSLKENIIFGSGKEFNEKKMRDSINFARLDSFIETLENGVDTHIGSTIKQLSSGQKQRIAIARSIYSDREIIIFDEATNALDNENEKIIINNLKNLKSKKTIIIISHSLENLKICEDIYTMDNGTLVKKN